MLMFELLVKIDNEMLEGLIFKLYFNYIFMIVLGKGVGDRVR